MRALIFVAGLLLSLASVGQVPKTGGGSTPPLILKIDRANQRVGIKNSAPSYPLDVAGIIRSSTGGFIFPDGSTQTSAATATGTASISFGTATATSGTVNLSTEGTTDWVDSNGVALANPSVSTSFVHKKMAGSDILARSLLFFGGGQTNVTMLANTDGPFSKATTAADDAALAGIMSGTTSTYTAIFSTTASATGYGYRFDAPCKTTSQTLNLYAGVYSGTATITATLPGGTTANTTIVSTASSGLQRKVPITYTCASSGDVMRVKAVLTTNLGASPNVQFYAVTIP